MTTSLFNLSPINRERLLTVAPLLFIGALSPIVAFLVTRGEYLYAVALISALPAAIVISRYPFAAFIIWLIILPLIPARPDTRYIYWAIHRSLIPLAVLLNLASRLFKFRDHPPIRMNWPDLAMITYVIMGFISVLVNNDFSSEVEFRELFFLVFDRILIPYFVYALARFLHPTSQDMTWLMWIAVGMCLIEGTIGILSWISPNSLPELWRPRQNILGFRGTGTFKEPGPYASAMMFFMIFIIQGTQTVYKNNRLRRLAFITLFMFGVVCILISFSRGSWLALLASLMVIVALYSRTFLPVIVGLLILSPVLLTTIFTDEADFALDRLSSVQSAGSRVLLGWAGQQMFLAKPVFGWGYATYDLHDWKFLERVDEFVPRRYEILRGTSHNSSITILAETGVVGFSLYMFPIAWFAVQSFQVWATLRREEDHDEFINWRFFVLQWVNVVFIMTIAQFIDLRFFWFNHGIMWFSLGMIANMIEKHQENKSRLFPTF